MSIFKTTTKGIYSGHSCAPCGGVKNCNLPCALSETGHGDSRFRWCAQAAGEGPWLAQKALAQQCLCLHGSSRNDCSEVVAVTQAAVALLDCYAGKFWIGVRKTHRIAEKKEKVPQPFGKRIGKTGRVITSEHQAGAWEQRLDSWRLYRISEDNGTLQMGKRQEQHSVMSQRVKQNYHWWRMPHHSCGAQSFLLHLVYDSSLVCRL